MANSLEQWWKELPIVTKYLFALSFGLTLAANFSLINPMLLVLNFTLVFKHFEIWRLLTCFFFHGKLGFPFLIHMMFLVRYGQSLEQTTFSGRTADFVFCLLFGSGVLLVAGWLLQLPILAMSLIMMIIYIWSRKNPNINMSFMFGIQFLSFYFPWVLVAFNFLMGGMPIAEIVGIVVGHVYYFLEDIYPLTSGRRLLKTPQIFYQWFPPAGPAVGAAPFGGAPRQAGHAWGAGRTLGD